ncbi:MAG: dihydrolipoamide acetyltransferase family protein, partial [Fimbriimonadaceae bacterium]
NAAIAVIGAAIIIMLAVLLAAVQTVPAASAPAEVAPAQTSKAPAEATSVPATTSSSNERIKASPLARRVAADAGVDLSAVTGTGPGGRIVHKDVLAAIGQQGSTLPKAAPQSAPVTASAEDVKVPINFLRKIIAERTHQSKMEAPHFYVTVEVDMEKIYTLREALKEEEAGNISVNDFVVRACALALREMPQVNSTYQGDHLLQLGNVNIGIAAAVDDGLLVPVIHHADQLTLRQIAAASKDLVTKARAGKLSPNEMSGSTFSISNMGMLDVDNFGAIINGPNAAILAISSARKKVVVTESDEVEVRWRMNMTASFDHRVVDGAVGAQFINIVRAYLESPMRLLS